MSARSAKKMFKTFCDDCEGTGHEVEWVWRRFNGNEGEEELVVKEEFCATCDGMGYKNDD